MTKVEILRSRTVQHDGDAALPRQMVRLIEATVSRFKHCTIAESVSLVQQKLTTAAAALWVRTQLITWYHYCLSAAVAH